MYTGVTASSEGPEVSGFCSLSESQVESDCRGEQRDNLKVKLQFLMLNYVSNFANDQ